MSSRALFFQNLTILLSLQYLAGMKQETPSLSLRFAAACAGVAALVSAVGPGLTNMLEQGKAWFPDPAAYQGYEAVMPWVMLGAGVTGAVLAYKAFTLTMR